MVRSACDNWERLVELVIRREQLRRLGIYSDPDDSLSSAWDEDIYFRASPSPPFSRSSLLEILEGITEWMSSYSYKTEIRWTESHLSVVLHYVLGVEAINPYFCSDSWAYSWLEDVCSCRFEPDLNSKRFTGIVVNFMAELQELFQVPKASAA